MAGGEGIEPSHALLESAVLPLYEPPTRRPKAPGLLRFLVQSVFFAPPAEFFQLQPVFKSFFIFLGKIIHSFAFLAFKFDQIVLGHKFDK